MTRFEFTMELCLLPLFEIMASIIVDHNYSYFI